MAPRLKHVQISDDVKAILSRAVVSGSRLQLVDGLDRPTYERVNKVIAALGGKWSRKEGAHLFDRPVVDVLAEALAAGKAVDAKQTYQFFPTPPELAAQLVELASPQPGHAVLEPSAGNGALVRALAAHARISGHTNYSYQVDLVEANPEHLADLNDPFLARCLGAVQVIIADFMAWQTARRYDRIVMNPPFTNYQDAEHVLRAWSLLKPVGRLVAIMAAGVKFRQERCYATIRQLVDDCGELQDLPAGSFRDSGTDVNSVLVTLNKEPDWL